MPLGDKDKERTRYHLGYPSIRASAAVFAGVPRPIAVAFLLEQNMNQLIEAAVPRVVDMLTELDKIEGSLKEAREFLIAEKVGNITLRTDLPQHLEEEYNRWACRLADTLGVPLYGFASRFNAGQGQGRAGGGIKMIRRG